MSGAASAGEVYYADDGTVSTVLDDVYDPSYEPNEQEIEEYAKFLGVDPSTEPQLLWLGRAGLKEPMPKEWKPCKTDTGDVYYFNFETGESIWDHPMDEVFKARVESERAKLKRDKGAYQPPPEALAAAAKGKAAAAGKGVAKKRALDRAEKKISEVDAKLASTGAASSFAAPLASIGPVGASKLPMTTNKLNALSAGGPSTLRAADPSLLLPTTAKAGMTTGGIPSAFGGGHKAITSAFGASTPTTASAAPATGLNAAKDAEKRIREKLAPEFEAKLLAIERSNETELEETNTDFAAKLKKIEKELSSQIDEEKDTALRAAERKAKRDIQEYEETLDSKRDQLRRELRTVRDQISDVEVTSGSSAKNAEKEIEAKKLEIQRTNEAEITRRRLEIHDSWRKEKEAADAKSQNELSDLKSTLESQRKAVEAKERAAYAIKIEEEETTLQANLQALKGRLAKQRAEAVADIQASGSASGANSQHNSAYLAAQQAYEAAIAAAKETVEESTGQERRAHQRRMAELREEHEAKMAEATAQAETKNAQKSSVAMQAAREESEAAIRAVENELADELDAELQLLDVETQRLERLAREEASGKLQGAAALANAAVEKARKAAVSEAEDEIARLKLKHQRELSAIEEEIEEAEMAAAKSQRSATSGSAVNEVYDRLRDEWLAANPSKVLGPLPSLPPVMQSAFDTGLSDAHREEIAAAVSSERTRRMASAEATLAALRAQMDSDMAKGSTETQLRTEADHRRRVEEYRLQLMDELNRENEALRRSVAADTASAKRTSVAASTTRRQSRQIEKVLRRKALRDGMETSHRREQSFRDAEISRLVTEEQGRLQMALEATTAQLAREHAGSFGPIPTLVDSRPATPERQRVNRPPLAPSAMGSGYTQHLAQSPLQAQMTFSGLTSEQNTPIRTQQQPGGPSFEGGYSNIMPPAGAAPFTQTHHNISTSSPLFGVISGGSQAVPPPAAAQTIGERLAKAREVLRKKKKELKARQEQLESARADWRIDMAAAKHNGDSSAIAVLMKIKKEMEAVAHNLNSETKDLLEAVAWLKAQEEGEGKRRAAAALYAGSSQPQLHPRHFADPMAMMGNSDPFASIPSANVNQLLAVLAAQTLNMERRVGSLGDSGPPGRSSQLSDPMSNKWTAWLNQQQQRPSPNKDRSSSAMAMGNNNNNSSSSALMASQLAQQQMQPQGQHNPHVNAWLQEQLFV